MKRWKGSIDLEKYYGERKYKEKRIELPKKEFKKEEIDQMTIDIFKYIKEKNYSLFHDLMDDICEANLDWFNLLASNKSFRQSVITYLKSKNASKYS